MAQTLEDPQALDRLLTDAQAKARVHGSKITEAWRSLRLMMKMLQAYLRGEYREIPYRSLLIIVGALLYFVNPFDAIPDPLLFGFVDDALVIGYVFSSVQKDINKFADFLSRPVS